MTVFRRGAIIVVGVVGLVAGVLSPASPAMAVDYTPVTTHLEEAEELVDNLGLLAWPGQSARNKYTAEGGSHSVVWGTLGDPSTYYNETQCAPFLTRLLQHSYLWAQGTFISTYFSSTSPNSGRYQYRLGNDMVPHFEPVTQVAELMPGDIIAITYNTSTGSGHTAIVRDLVATVELDGDPTTAEYVVQVVDSTDAPHGTAPVADGYSDTRSRPVDPAAPTGLWTEYSGVGYGHMLFYANADGTFRGYRWGTDENPLHTVGSRPITAARVYAEAEA